MAAARELPNVAAILAPLLERVSREKRPLLIAIAERMAAARYRDWAAQEDATRRADLLACADREEAIAARVEALHPDSAAATADIGARNPDLAEINRGIFAGRPVAEQYEIQAKAERVGALTWRSFAEHAEPAARAVFLACADLEEQSAAVLESILRDAGRGPDDAR